MMKIHTQVHMMMLEKHLEGEIQVVVAVVEETVVVVEEMVA